MSRHYHLLIGTFVYNLPLGILYSFAAVNTLLTSSLRAAAAGDDDDSLDQKKAVWISASQLSSFGFFFAVGCLARRGRASTTGVVSFLALMTAGQFSLFAALLWTKRAMTRSLWEVVVSYGVMGGGGAGLGFSATFQTVVNSCPARRGGLCIGVLVSSLGVGSLFIGLSARISFGAALAAADGGGSIADDEAAVERIPGFFTVLALACFSAQTLGLAMVAVGNWKQERGPVAASSSTTQQQPKSLKSIVSSGNFAMLWLTFFCNAISVSYVLGSLVERASAVVHDEPYRVFVAAVSAMFNAVGSVFWGHVFDCCSSASSGFWVPMGVSSLSVGGLLVALPLFASYLSFAVISWAISFFSSAFLVLVPAEAWRIFGERRECALAFGFLLLGVCLASPLVAVLVTSVLKAVHVIGLSLIFAACCGIAAWSAFWKRQDDDDDVRRSIRDFFGWEWDRSPPPSAAAAPIQ